MHLSLSHLKASSSVIHGVNPQSNILAVRFGSEGKSPISAADSPSFNLLANAVSHTSNVEDRDVASVLS